MRKRVIYLGLTVLTAVIFLGVSAAVSDVIIQYPPDTDGIDTDGDGDPDNDHVLIHLAGGDGYADMADGRRMYMFGFSDVTDHLDNSAIDAAMLGAEWPSPTISMREGQRLYLNMTNVGMMVRPDLFDPHTIHWHGYPNAAPIFDGVPSASIAINMMSTLTYYYVGPEPGTYIYHCHVEATEHMQMGMLGQIYVTPKQNYFPGVTDLDGFIHETGNKYAYNDGDGSTYYDVEYPLQLGGFDPNFHDESETVQPLSFALLKDTYPMINGRGYPDTINPDPIPNSFNGNLSQKETSLIVATKGEKILLRLSSLSTTDFYTVTVLGIPMKLIAKDARQLKGPDGKDFCKMTASVTLGGGETRDVLLDTSEVQPGTYFLYTTNMNFLSNNTEDYGGMMTEIIINP